MKNRIPFTKLWLFSLLIGGSLLLAACNITAIASGNVVTQEMDFEDFDRVAISDAFNVDIVQGDEYRVVIMVDEAAQPYLDVKQRGDMVSIGLVPRPFVMLWSFSPRFELRAEITMPNLVALDARDATDVEVSGFNTDGEVRIEVSDASLLTGEIASGDAYLRASDASRINLEGNRHNVEIEASGASQVHLTGQGQDVTIRAMDASRVDLSDFPVQDAQVEAHDASNVTVDVAGTLDAEASDASDIVYYGEPTMGNTSSHDGSSITQRDR